jgi:hypothetical protein
MDLTALRSAVGRIIAGLTDSAGKWKVRGFIDVDKKVYSLTADTKVLSKALELVLLPGLLGYFKRVRARVELAEHQNHYPDISLTSSNEKVALDIKTTYTLSARGGQVNGLTLGAYTGYFRDRRSAKNVTYPYSAYKHHIVLGLVYDRNTNIKVPEVFELRRLADILAAIKNIRYFVHEKWRLASDRPGSGNTKNIGSSTALNRLIEGEGIFTRFGVREGKRVFDDYWQHYLTKEMARAAELKKPPFTNLREYLKYRNRRDLIAKLGPGDE